MKNTYLPKFTYIIPFKYSLDRIIPLKRVLEWLTGYNGIEIIVVEQGKNSKLSNLCFKGKHIFVESDLPFNKSWLYNVALKRIQSQVVVFGDADCLMHPNDLIESLKALESADCVIPTSNVIRLTPQESHADLQSILSFTRTGNKMCLTDGISLFKKEAIDRIGGWNEDILGMGYANKFQDLKIKNLLNFKQLNFNYFHFHHHMISPDINLNQRNQQILDYYTTNVNDLRNHVANTYYKFGFINKYQD